MRETLRGQYACTCYPCLETPGDQFACTCNCAAPINDMPVRGRSAPYVPYITLCPRNPWPFCIRFPFTVYGSGHRGCHKWSKLNLRDLIKRRMWDRSVSMVLGKQRVCLIIIILSHGSIIFINVFKSLDKNSTSDFKIRLYMCVCALST